MKKLLFYLIVFVVLSGCDLVKPKPKADFEFKFLSQDNISATYAFVNKSKNHTQSSWYFADKLTGGSTKESDVYTFYENSTYNVRLIVKNENGEDRITKPVTVSEVPDKGQFTFVTTCNRGAIAVSLENVSVGSITSKYNSTPTNVQCGESGNVTVTRAPGTYNFKAVSSQGSTWAGTITVVSGLCRSSNLTCN